MTNENTIINLSGQLKAVAERVCNVVSGYEFVKDSDPEIAEVYERFVLDEVSHAQIIVLELTRLLTEGGEEKEDEAFGPGELEENIGEKDEETYEEDRPEEGDIGDEEEKK